MVVCFVAVDVVYKALAINRLNKCFGYRDMNKFVAVFIRENRVAVVVNAKTEETTFNPKGRPIFSDGDSVKSPHPPEAAHLVLVTALDGLPYFLHQLKHG